ncbi:hypothetical protein KSS87_005282, partial [Heliosperma pusillum]
NFTSHKYFSPYTIKKLIYTKIKKNKNYSKIFIPEIIYKKKIQILKK